MRLALWAPVASTVALVLDDDRLQMVAEPHGWWAADAPVSHGDRYAFAVDGGPPIPDPRSFDQPDGIDAPSAVYLHDRFEWHDEAWTGIDPDRAVLYELHVGTFSTAGTFDAAIEHLAHLRDLGVDAVELLPVATGSGTRGWGYDGVQLFAPHPAYGGPDGLKRLVDACHAHGLAVVMDVVYNHFGPAGNHLPEVGPYLTDQHHTFWGDAVNFDGPGSAEVRRFIIHNALMWLRDFHCDGLRLDAVHAITDTSPVHVLAELGAAVAELAETLERPLFVMAESDLNDPVFVRPRPEGYGLDAAWADEWHHALHAVLTGERDGYYEDFGSLDHLVKALRQAWVYDGTWSPHRGRVHGRPPAGLAASCFVVAAQNHDQVGNRATGERLTALTSEGRARIAAALLLTSPFLPLLFQGEEWAASSPFQYFTDHPDPGLAQSVRDGRRSEFAAFGWSPEAVPDPQDEATFQRSKLRWEERTTPPHAEMLAWYQALLRLRRSEPDLHDPGVGVQARHDDGLLTVDRGRLRLHANLGTEPHAIHRGPDHEVVLAFPEGIVADGTEVVLPVDSVVLLTTAPPPAADG